MSIQLKSTRLRGYDADGGAIVRLETNRGHYENELRAFTQSDANVTFKGMLKHPEVPSNIVAHISRLDGGLRYSLTEDPQGVSEAPDRDLFIRATGLNSDALRVAAGISPEELPWKEKHDRDWLLAMAGTKADVVALPAKPKETPGSLFERLEAAKEYVDGLALHDQQAVAPTLRLDSRFFRETIEKVIDFGEPLVVIEFHGLARATTNLAIFHELMETTNTPPYAIGTNVPRMAQTHRGSGTLIAARYGIQASAPKIHYGRPGDVDEEPEEALSRMWWFCRHHGGYLPAGELPADWAEGCECPDAADHLYATHLHDAFAPRRRHETWAHLQERRPITEAISRQEYWGEYVASRPVLQRALRAIS